MDFIQVVILTLVGGLVLTLLLFQYQSNGFAFHKSLIPSGLSSSSSSPYNKPTFLILGANNSGKTSLYYKLIRASKNRHLDDDEKVNEGMTPTVSSMELNATSIELPFSNTAITKNYQLIDYPGHLKYQELLYKLMIDDIKLQKIRGIVYVLDSSSISINSENLIELKIAKFLYQIFSITERMHNGIDFLFAVNKSDLFDSLPVHKLKGLLESELNKLITDELNSVNKSSGIDNANDDDKDDNGDGKKPSQESLREFWLSVIGSRNKEFTFDKLEGNMDFVTGSVLRNKIEGWENWFDEKVVNN
ncbi:signal recognition particle receptor beta subunit-domain-containing protein [Scheffersomyces coipomensis]|uniref:signal recognition particle receptor beta subunit-domain-containing protein n=1 Tax=Scheffersomyces coipomensis TaxID=1788519 RepID=UPI00315D739E